MLGRITSSAWSTTITGTLHTNPNAFIVIDFFAGSEADLSGQGEGAKFLGSAVVTTDDAVVKFWHMPGDTNRDRRVDFSDLVAIAQNCEMSLTAMGAMPRGAGVPVNVPAGIAAAAHPNAGVVQCLSRVPASTNTMFETTRIRNCVLD